MGVSIKMTKVPVYNFRLTYLEMLFHLLLPSLLVLLELTASWDSRLLLTWTCPLQEYRLFWSLLRRMTNGRYVLMLYFQASIKSL